MNKSGRTSSRIIPRTYDGIGDKTIHQWMVRFAMAIQDYEAELTELDQAIGDGDHGINMHRGMSAAVARLNELVSAEPYAQLRSVSMTLTSTIGGSSGPLYGAFFLQSSHVIHHRSNLTLAEMTLVIDAGYRGVVQLGKAEVGDKTMVDTLDAAVKSLRASTANSETIPTALERCRQAARQAARNTIPMIAKRGRASYLGERSAGTQDPGATSACLLFDALAQAFQGLSEVP